jgi:hypothetical protein
LTYVCTLDNDFARDLSLAPNPADAFNLADRRDFALDLNLIHKIKLANAAAPMIALPYLATVILILS